MRKLIVLFFLSIWIFSINFVYADDSDWTLIPTASEKVKNLDVWDGKTTVWKVYNEKAKELESNKDVWWAFASGIFSWNLIFQYLKYLAKLLSQIGLVIGAWMIIYAGYKYVIGVFTQDNAKSGKDSVKWAIYGLLIVIFSYAIMRILLSMFW